jgi:outer membrane lipoprotein-sorting protein
MKKVVQFICAVLFVLVPMVRLAGAQTYTLDQILSKMSEANRNFRSLEASVERTSVDVLVKTQDTEYGKVYFKRGKDAQPMIRFDFNKPSEHVALIAQGKVQLYNPKIKQVQQMELGKDSDKAELLLVGFGQSSEQLKQSYNVSFVKEETVAGQKMSVLDLKPKSERVAAMFSVIRLWVDQKQWLPLQVQETEAGSRGDYQIVKFTNLKLNTDIKDSVFKLNLPKDVQLVK